MPKKYRYSGRTPENLGSGQPLAWGDVVSLSADEEKDQHNSRLIDEGLLLAVPGAGKKDGDSK